MTSFQKQNRIAAAAVFLAVFFVYLRTVTPNVAFWDCGEFISTSYILGVPHPPGAPLYTLVGRIMSMLPLPGKVAFHVNLISVITGAATALLLYLCTVRLLCSWLDPAHPTNRIAIFAGGAVAALCSSFSTSNWYNSTEAEVYAVSMCFTLLVFWLALCWDEGHRDRHNDRRLLLIAYLFGLGAGVHLQCLLTLPGILILVFTDLLEDRPFRQQVLVVAGVTLYPFLAILLPLPLTALMTLVILVALIALRPAWRNPWFWVCALLLGVLGYSTYLGLILRSGFDPLIDMNNPANLKNFQAFISRQQYGVHALFPRRGAFWGYQFDLFIRYFVQQFPFYLNVQDRFRTAIMPGKYDVIAYSLIPFLFGFWGAVYHLRQDWKRFAVVFAMFALMGVGLVLYLNMPDPEPRERDYIFVGAYTFFCLWMGMGATALVLAVVRSSASIPLAVGAAVLVLLLPSGILERNFFSHDRSRDYIAHDYAYNLLQSCAPNAILFTNGDNDTYPLWYLQYVEHVRPDIRTVNLSLLKTPWYAMQLRDVKPKIPIHLTDAQIENEVAAQPWRKPVDVEVAGLTVKAADVPTTEYLVGNSNTRIPVVETHTLMIWWILKQVNWTRPIYFAVTVPNSNMAGLRPYLSMEGMVFHLNRDRAAGQFDVAQTRHNLFDVYRFTGVADSTVYKDDVARRLLGNYLVLIDGLTRAYLQQHRPGDAFQTLQKAETLVPSYSMESSDAWAFLANRYRETAIQFGADGKVDSALTSLKNLVRLNPNVDGQAAIQNIIRLETRVREDIDGKRYEDAFQTLQKAGNQIPDRVLGQLDFRPHIAGYYRILALKFSDAGRIDRALTCMESLVRVYPEVHNRQKIEQVIRTWRAKLDST